MIKPKIGHNCLKSINNSYFYFLKTRTHHENKIIFDSFFNIIIDSWPESDKNDSFYEPSKNS